MEASAGTPLEQTSQEDGQSLMQMAERLLSESERFYRFSRTCMEGGKPDEAAVWQGIATACRLNSNTYRRKAIKLLKGRS